MLRLADSRLSSRRRGSWRRPLRKLPAAAGGSWGSLRLLAAAPGQARVGPVMALALSAHTRAHRYEVGLQHEHADPSTSLATAKMLKTWVSQVTEIYSWFPAETAWLHAQALAFVQSCHCSNPALFMRETAFGALSQPMKRTACIQSQSVKRASQSSWIGLFNNACVTWRCEGQRYRWVGPATGGPPPGRPPAPPRPPSYPPPCPPSPCHCAHLPAPAAAASVQHTHFS